MYILTNIFKNILLLYVFLLISLSHYSVYAQSNEINPNGYNVFYYENNNKSSEGTMKDGKPEGYWKTYYEDEVIKSEGNRVNHLLDSIWKFYSKKGILIKEIPYKNDKKNGYLITYNDEGFIISRENFIDDVRDGNSYYYYKNSNKLKEKKHFTKNKEDGKSYEYDKEGNIITITTYNNSFVQRKEQINRRDTKGLKQGVWKWFWEGSDEIIKLEGRYKDDKKNGYFSEYDKKGKLLWTTKYENDKAITEFEELENIEIRNTFYSSGKIRTTGSYKNNKPEGVTREYNEQGNIINSWIYKEGFLLGEGILNEEGMKVGFWKEYYKDGSIKAEGEYKNGLRIGKWTYYHKNKHISQTGNQSNGEKPDGERIWYYPNDTIRRIYNFRKGLEEGLMVEDSDSGKIITKGNFIEGEREGDWFYEIGDHMEKGSYKNGLMYGEGVFYYKNNNKSFKDNYIMEVTDGEHVYYYPNVKVML